MKMKIEYFTEIRLLNYRFLNFLLVPIICYIVITSDISYFYTVITPDISYLDIMCITQIRNFVPENELKNLKTYKIYHNLFENLISVLRPHSFYKIKTLGKVFLLRTYLFNLLNLPCDRILTYHELEFFREGVMNLLYSDDGYMNKERLENDKLLNFYRSLNQEEMKGSFTEIQSFHTLIIMMILLEYELYSRYYEDLYNLKTLEKELVKTMLMDMKETKRNLRKLLIPEVKALLSKTRVNIKNIVYSGFDTEFQMLSSEENEMLAYTLCSYSKQYICIKNLEFNIIESLCKDQLIEMIKIVRLMNKKFDVEIDQLAEKLTGDKNEIEKIECKNFILFSKREKCMKDFFKTSFYDLEETGNVYSIKELVEKSLKSQEDRISELTEYHQKVLVSVRLPRLPVKKEVVLIAHFTTADVSSLADFHEYKSRFSILRKSFVTLDKSIRMEGWKVILRDTSLLSPGNASLKSIGELYNSEFNKISIPEKMKSRMKKLKKKSRDLFIEYAKQDAVITL